MELVKGVEGRWLLGRASVRGSTRELSTHLVFVHTVTGIQSNRRG